MNSIIDSWMKEVCELFLTAVESFCFLIILIVFGLPIMIVMYFDERKKKK